MGKAGRDTQAAAMEQAAGCGVQACFARARAVICETSHGVIEDVILPERPTVLEWCDVRFTPNHSNDNWHPNKRSAALRIRSRVMSDGRVIPSSQFFKPLFEFPKSLRRHCGGGLRLVAPGGDFAICPDAGRSE